MPRLQARIQTQLPAKVFFVYDGTVIEEMAVIRSLSASGAFLDFLSPRYQVSLRNGKILYLQLRLSGNTPLDLVGEIVRCTADGFGLRFIFLGRPTKSALWEHVRARLCRSATCPFCAHLRDIETRRCENCKFYLDFDDPLFFDIHEKETFLQQIHARTRRLDADQLIGLLNSIDNELLKSSLNQERPVPVMPEYPTKRGGAHTENASQANRIDLFACSHHSGMAQVLVLMTKAAETEVPVLILGESGTGKELTARAIHDSSLRKSGPFIPINCAAIPESLLESEVFGYARGAFTGAHKDKKGWIECADSGTLFLDEIGEMVPALQAKLLRVLQNGEFCRVGSTQIMHCDVRVLAATNIDLKKRIGEGGFRHDLYYRMNVIEIELPPLRDRRCDILTIANDFMRKFGEQYRKPGLRFSRKASDALLAYPYPGNIRELENIVHRAVILSETGTIESFHLPKHLSSLRTEGATADGQDSFRHGKQQAIEAFERNFITERLRDSHGNITSAANAAGIDIKNFHTKMKRYGIDPREFKIR